MKFVHKKIVSSIVLLLIVYLVVSCSQVPFPTTYRLNTQKKMQAAHHWDVLAADVAEQVKIFIDRNEHLKDIPTYVSSPDTTPFGNIFHDLLISHLITKGIVVSRINKNSITIKYEVQVLEHSDRFVRHPPFVYSALALGILVAREAPVWFTGLGLASLADYGRGLTTGDLPNKEVIITTSLVSNDRYMMHKSDIYYINVPDSWHYEQGAKKTYRVVD